MEAFLMFAAGCGLVTLFIPAIVIVTASLTLWYGKYYWSTERAAPVVDTAFRRSRCIKSFVESVWPTTVRLPDTISAPFPDDQPILIAAHPHGICSSACAAFGCVGPDPQHHWLAKLISNPYRGRAAVTHWLMSVPLLCDLCRSLGMFPVSRQSLKRALFHHKPEARHSVLLHPGGVEEFMGESAQKVSGPYVECRKHTGFLKILWEKRHHHPVPLVPVYYRGEHRRSNLSMPWPWLSRKVKPWLCGLPVGCFWLPRWGVHSTVVEVYGPLWAKDFDNVDAFATAYQALIEGACQREIDQLRASVRAKSA